MAEVILKDIVKIYPYVDKKPRKKLMDKILRRNTVQKNCHWE